MAIDKDREKETQSEAGLIYQIVVAVIALLVIGSVSRVHSGDASGVAGTSFKRRGHHWMSVAVDIVVAIT